MPRPESLNALYDRIRHIEAPAKHGVLPFDVPEIDRALPGGGLALGAVHEILGADGDEEDGAAAAGFTAGILARLGPCSHPPAASATGPPSPALRERGQACGSVIPLSRIAGEGGEPRRGEPGEGNPRLGAGPVLWCLKRPDLYGPGLIAHGLDPSRLVLVLAKRDDEILWAMEEGLRMPGLAAVVGEVGRLPMVAGRRLQLAAERSGVTAFLLRRWRDAEQATTERERPSAALTRWRVTALPSLDTAPQKNPLPPAGGEGRVRGASGGRGNWIGHPRWRVELLRCRGGVPAQWIVESGEVPMDLGVADATGHVSLSAALADRPAAPPRREAARIAPAEPFRRAG